LESIDPADELGRYDVYIALVWIGVGAGSKLVLEISVFTLNGRLVGLGELGGEVNDTPELALLLCFSTCFEYVFRNWFTGTLGVVLCL
jgi:hypothetical protein